MLKRTMFSTCIKFGVVVLGLLVSDLTFGVEGVDAELAPVPFGDGGEAVEAGEVEVGVIAKVGVTAGDGLVDFDCGSVSEGYNNNSKKLKNGGAEDEESTYKDRGARFREQVRGCWGRDCRHHR